MKLVTQTGVPKPPRITITTDKSSNLTGTPANLEIALAALKRATGKLLSAYRSLPEPAPTPAAPPNGDKPDAA